MVNSQWKYKLLHESPKNIPTFDPIILVLELYIQNIYNNKEIRIHLKIWLEKKRPSLAIQTMVHALNGLQYLNVVFTMNFSILSNIL